MSDSRGPWPEGAVIYQIYPRSFRDSDGDGVGDLKGIADKLDHVAGLGVDAIWLSPFFVSPMRDFGYDVADYCDVDPLFGTLADFDLLLAKAHGLGLKVIIDQVYSHTSDQHLWFAESRRDRTNAKADWYVWADPDPAGAPPNNWMSVFGGVAWEWDARRRQYYLHNFLASQPDLNLHNSEVQDALLQVTRFWLDRGVDGFRLDAINFAMHDPTLRDNPPARRRDREPARPFDFQDHFYNQSHPDIAKFLERIRAVTDNYADIFTVAEVVGPDPIGEMKAFTLPGKRLTSAYNFDFLYADALTPARVRRSLSNWPGGAGESLPSWAFSNHDAPRCVSRWADSADRERAARLYFLLLMALRGHVFVYQGEELGLPQAEVAFADLKDPEAIANWPETLGRDGARTPFPWDADAPFAGFSTSRPWLPVDPRHVPLAAAAQARDARSFLAFAQAAIAFRRQSPALRRGALEFLDTPDEILAFSRTCPEGVLLCVFNMSAAPIAWRPPDWEAFSLAFSTSGPAGGDLPAALAPYDGYVAKKRAG